MKSKQLKNDLYAILGLSGLMAIFIAVLLCDGGLFGSNLDWVNQHSVIPELFRQQFYETKEFFPSLALQLGAGQNIYHFAYYGLNSPIILLSYFLPFIPMHIYLSIAAIAALYADLVLFFLRCRKQHGTKVSTLLTFFFLFSGSLILHSHRHIMFVIYMPFLLLALNACDRMLRGGSKVPLILCSFLVLMTSFYFSVGAFIAILLYAIYQINSTTDKRCFWFVPLCLFIAGLCAMVLLLPTAYCLLQGRTESNTSALSLGLFLPSITTSMYYYYSLGTSAIGLISILLGVKSKPLRFLSASLLALLLIPLLTYLLNAGMYMDGKVLIPFLPLVSIPLGAFLEDLFKNKPLKHPWFLGVCCALLILCEILCGTHSSGKYIAYFVLECAFVFLGFCLKNRRLALVPIVCIVGFNCVYHNFKDDLVNTDAPYLSDVKDIQALLGDIDDTDFYRCGNLKTTHDSVNQVYNNDYYQTSVYSSSENSRYRNFYLNEIYNNVPYRNSALLAQSNNYIFNQYMGVRYLITPKDQELFGYDAVAQRGNVCLQKSETALPIGYRAAKLMSEKQYRTLAFPYNVEALMNYTIVSNAPEVFCSSRLERIEFTPAENLPAAIRADENGFIIESDENFTVQFPALSDQLVFLRCRVSHLDEANSTDVYVTINGAINMLTEAGWKYHNGNNLFEYVLADIGGYTAEFSAGRYRIDDIEVYTMPFTENEVLQKTADILHIDREKTKGDQVFGTITCAEAGVVTLSIPYEDGYKVFIDGRQAEIFITDTAFIGFEIEDGTHDIELRYTAPGLNLGKAISLFGLACVLAIAAWELIIRRSRR